MCVITKYYENIDTLKQNTHKGQTKCYNDDLICTCCKYLIAVLSFMLIMHILYRNFYHVNLEHLCIVGLLTLFYLFIDYIFYKFMHKDVTIKRHDINYSFKFSNVSNKLHLLCFQCYFHLSSTQSKCAHSQSQSSSSMENNF